MKPGLRIIAWSVYLVSRLLLLTWRVRVTGQEARAAAAARHPAGCVGFAVWHERCLASILVHRHQPIAPLASLSADGAIVAFVCDRLGMRTIRGSSSRGGREALRTLAQMIRSGMSTALTVDGPRGPRREVKPGIVDLARRTGIAILPLATVGGREWALRSWDRFKIPWPFCRVVARYGEPIFVPEDLPPGDFDAMLAKVKSGIDRAEELAIQDLAAWSRGDRHSFPVTGVIR